MHDCCLRTQVVTGCSREAGMIRPALPEELDEIATLWKASWDTIGITIEADLGLPELRTRLRERVPAYWDLYVYEYETRIVGMLALMPAENILSEVFVAPAYQGRGIGKALMMFARQKMPTEIHLSTAANNHRAAAWYVREGFEITDMRIHEEMGREMLDFTWRFKA